MEENLMLGIQKTLWERIAYGILLGMTFLVPIFFIPLSFISTQFGTSLLFAFGVIIALILCIVSSLVRGSLDLPQPAKYILGFMSVVPIVYTLAGVANGFSRMSFFGYTFDMSTVGFILLSFAYLFLLSLLFRNKSSIFYSYVAFVFSSLIFSLFLIIRLVFGVHVLSFGVFTDITSTMIGSWNNVGIFFGGGAILSLLTLGMLAVSRLMKVLLSLCLVLALFFLALVNFNSIWIILGITSFLFILYSIFAPDALLPETVSMKERFKKIPVYSLIVLVVSIVFVIWSSTLGTYFANTFKASNVEVRPSLSVTLDIARNTLRSRPLFGSGPNTFVTQWLSFKPDDITSTVFWNTDFTNGIGLIPTFAVTTGIVGVLSWLLFFGFYIYLGIRSIFARVEDRFMSYLLASSFFVSLYFWVMAWIYIPSTVIFILTFFFTGLFFASVYVAGLVPIVPRVFSRTPKMGFLFSLALVTLFVAALSLGYGLLSNSRSLWYFQKSSYALNTSHDIPGAESYMLKAISTIPYDVYYRALSEIELNKLSAILSTDPKTQTAQSTTALQTQFSAALSSAIKAGQAATAADPSNYLNWIALARVYAAVSDPQLKISGAYESAQFAYSEALRHNPKNPGIFILLAQLAATHGDLNQAKQYALQAISIKQNYLDAYFLLSQIEVANKNIQGAIDSVTAASILSPNDSSIFFQLGLLKYNIQDFNGAITALEKSIALTTDYANAKYFLGLSYEATGQHQKAIQQFTDLKASNPDNKDVDVILTNLLAGKSIFTNTQNTAPEKGSKLPVKQTAQ